MGLRSWGGVEWVVGRGWRMTWRQIGLCLFLLLQLVIAVQSLQVPYPQGAPPPAAAAAAVTQPTWPALATPSQHICCCRSIAY